MSDVKAIGGQHHNHHKSNETAGGAAAAANHTPQIQQANQIGSGHGAANLAVNGANQAHGIKQP